MYIFIFILGIICGFGGKLGADWYADWKAEQKDLIDRMDKAVRTFDALELTKKL